TEELISKLSLVKGLRIIARTSVMRYKNQDKGVSEIGRELGVAYVVEGSVRKATNKIRVTAQLIDTKSEEHMWTSNYDEKLDDIFAVQSDIATKISQALPGSLASPITSHGETTNVTAYSYYLKGKQLLNERSDESLRQALDLLNSATQLDPAFARAYVEAGNCYAFLGMRGYVSYEEAVAGMKATGQKAIEIDENLAEGHGLLSFIAWVEDDHEMDRKEAIRAIELNPNLAEAHLRLAYVKATNGHLEEAIEDMERAELLDPLSSEIIFNLGMGYFWTGREREALDLWNRNRRFLPYIVAKAMVEYYLEKKDFERAEEELKLMAQIAGEKDFDNMVLRASLLALRGDREAAEEAIRTLQQSFKNATAITDRVVGFIRYYLGDTDAFFAAMFRAVDTHVLDPFRLRYSLLLEEARKDPRYREVLVKNRIDPDSRNK
ncbi:MAG TPA: hypothetical protein VED17_04885, partial [Nitrososphaerales archaeon]|nr:hypothetical protein [Nitrososphaerales archaeon]